MKYFYGILIALLNMQACCAKRFLVFGGKTGWLGQQIMVYIQEQGHEAVAATARLEDRLALVEEIKSVKPDYIINAAGVTGRPNVDWCEDHKQETIRSNIIGALNLADIAYTYGIHMTNIGTGCIYEYDAEHPLYSSIGFKEDDRPNFDGSFYAKTKIMLETFLCCYPNVLNLRVRMPISSDVHPRNFITKITNYQKVVNIPNSMTVLDDLLPLVPQMALRGLVGVYNFVNPGVISHNEILELYKHYINPNFQYTNFTLEEQNKILKAKRSNNELDATKLLQQFPTIPSIKHSIVAVFKKMSKSTIYLS